MKKILFGLVTLIGLCFSFSNAGSYTYNGSINNFSKTYYNNTSCNSVVSIPILKSSSIPFNSNFSFDYNCSISNQNINTNGVFGVSISYYNMSSASFSIFNITNNPLISDVPSSHIWYYINICFKKENSGQETVNLSFDWSCIFSGNDLLDDSSSSCDYSQYETEIQTLSGNLSTCQSSLGTCQSSLGTCQSNYSNCQTTLSGYVNTLDNVSSNLTTCNSSLSACLQSNCPEIEVPEVSWSSFWVNNTQIQGASNIYLYMPDFLSWDYTYLNSGATLQIDVDNEGDEDYINNLLTIETYHPTSNEFAVSFVGYLTLLMPYIIITLFIVFVWKLIKKIFR